MNKTKKYVTIGVVVLCICAAVYLNWSYNNEKAAWTQLDGAGLADAKSQEELAETGLTEQLSDYFATARLTRQQSRDEALSLLRAAAAAETASQETIDGAMNAIAAMASYSMMETQIENLLLAKNFADCVAFISGDGVILAVPAPAEGLTAEQVAQITDTIVTETDFTPTQLRVIEVKNNAQSPTPTAAPSTTTPNNTAAPNAPNVPNAPNAPNNPNAPTDGIEEDYDDTWLGEDVGLE